MNGLTYLFYIEEDVIPLEGSLTLGNHLDNDIIVAGEDVADFHLRVAIDERGPELIPLGQSTVNVNGYEHDTPVRIVIGDVIGIGAESIQVGLEEEVSEIRVDAWHLVPEAGSEILVDRELTIGRSDEAVITINDPHVSRIHARIFQKNQHVWFQDLRSANGSRVNGQKIQGGVQLFHGDQISVDRHGFQLVGTSDELTPINRFVDPLRGTDKSLPTPAAPVIEELPKEGAYLRSIADNVTYYLKTGSQSIGTAPDCDIKWAAESNVIYAALELSAEGFVLTRVAGIDTVQVNGVSEDRKALHSGDRLSFGGTEFEFVVPDPIDPRSSSSLTRQRVVIATVSIIVVLVGLLLLL